MSLSKLDHDINYHKKPKNSYFIQFYCHYLAKPKIGPMNPIHTHPILFKAQEYLYLAIFEKLMIQIHDKTMEFKSMAIYLSKTQFTLTISKPNSHWQYQSPVLADNI